MRCDMFCSQVSAISVNHFFSNRIASRWFRGKISLNLRLLMTPSRSICKSKISVLAKLLWIHNISHNISGCVWRCHSGVTVMWVQCQTPCWTLRSENFFFSFCINKKVNTFCTKHFQWNILKYPAIFLKLLHSFFSLSHQICFIFTIVCMCAVLYPYIGSFHGTHELHMV